MNNPLIKLAWGLLILGLIISIYLIFKTICDDFWIWGNKTDFTITAQFGDFVGGVIGTVFTLSGTLLIFLSFREQTKQNKREAFESAFFEMINLHSQNVNQLNYTKSNGEEKETSHHRKVFRVIFQEFIECFREVKKFSNSKNVDDYLNVKYKNKLSKIITDNDLKVNIIELAIIDIAYSIIYYGINQEGEIFLKDRFQKKYKGEYYYRILKYIKLKPKKENYHLWNTWNKLSNLDYKDFKQANEDYYLYRPHNKNNKPINTNINFPRNNQYQKYYGGHQHRLGHYFRHLFQCYKYINYHNDLSENEKYFYGKTLRAQLSTYEQALLFINSISSIGMKWELTPEYSLLDEKQDKKRSHLISQYNLIKNLPEKHFSGIRYKNYYPEVKFDSEE